MKSLFHAFVMCQSMFCAIPCPVQIWDEQARDKLLWCLPLVGLEIGLVWCLGSLLCDFLALPVLVQGAVLCAAPWILTGSIHLDGFMDVTDAVRSYRSLERRREILKDSHVGSFSVIAMGLLLVMQLSACSALCILTQLRALLPQIAAETSLEQLRGLEGAGATIYFSVFDQMILGKKPLFAFSNRNRRPPLDPVNALLSFAYSLLTHDCASALESVGLDAYVGFLHRDRPGRTSFALDLMEELRPCLADRFVLTLINNRVVHRDDFQFRENGAVYLTDSGRKVFLTHWQERKKAELTHPYLGEKIPWGLVPYVQALLLARTLRDDLEEYPPFLWK